MATIKKLGLGAQQFGGFTPYGNLTTIRAKLETSATGGAIGADSSTAIASGDVVVLEKLPAGMVLEDAQVIVSTAMTASVTGSLGFIYADGVDSTEAPQDAAYFGAGLVLNAAGRLRCATTNAPVKLPKEAFLVLTTGGAANAKASRIDVIVHGERMGPK